ncbi:hypothetical protein N2W52_002014 [Clostridium perfringens]|nr:hypothetical protein [Clostridium perfringens]MDK0983031.1 hypothetical protein [Clostridium perfringens]
MRIRFVNKTQYEKLTKFLTEVSQAKSVKFKDRVIISMPYKNPFKNILRLIGAILGNILEIILDIWEIIKCLCKIPLSFLPCMVIRVNDEEEPLVIKPEIRKGV